MHMMKTNFDYKGYTMWSSNDHIIMLYIPKTQAGNTHHALSFDNGRTWCIGNNKKIALSGFKGSFTEAIDVCVKLNEEIKNEKQ